MNQLLQFGPKCFFTLCSKFTPRIFPKSWLLYGHVQEKLTAQYLEKPLFRKWVISTQIWVRRLVCFVIGIRPTDSKILQGKEQLALRH